MPASSEFQTTNWSNIRKASTESAESPHEASKLLQDYWYPCYAFLRRKGVRRHDAEDMLQGFFASVIEKNWVALADPDRGKFRSFLVSSLQQYTARTFRYSSAARRAPHGAEQSSLEEQYALEPVDNETPEKVFEYVWAVSIVRGALQELEEECKANGQGKHFELVQGFLTQDRSTSGSEAARSLGMTHTAIRAYVHRLKRRLARIIRRKVSNTVSTTGPDRRGAVGIVAFLGTFLVSTRHELVRRDIAKWNVSLFVNSATCGCPLNSWWRSALHAL